MAKKWAVQAQVRELTGKKAKRLLRQGWVPGVVFGPKMDSISVQIPQQELMSVLHGAGTTNLVDLKLGSKTIKVLIKELDHEPISRRLRHVNLWAVDTKEELTMRVPLVFVGEAPAVRHGGVLVHQLDHVEVRCLPTDIPDSIPVDLSHLEGFHEPIRVSDLPVPAGVQIITDAEAVVAVVEPPKVEVEVEEEAAVEAAEAAEQPEEAAEE